MERRMDVLAYRLIDWFDSCVYHGDSDFCFVLGFCTAWVYLLAFFCYRPFFEFFHSDVCIWSMLLVCLDWSYNSLCCRLFTFFWELGLEFDRGYHRTFISKVVIGFRIGELLIIAVTLRIFIRVIQGSPMCFSTSPFSSRCPQPVRMGWMDACRFLVAVCRNKKMVVVCPNLPLFLSWMDGWKSGSKVNGNPKKT